ncbi:Putative ribonuclease H protein At1g65750 [Linum perenne]
MPPKFAQMFVFDTANEIKHRMNSFPSDINDISEQIIKELKDMFDEHNVLVKVFRYARDRLNADGVENVKIKLTGNRSSDRREYDLPTIDELAILIVDETGEDTYHPDIVVQHISNEMERLSFFHPSLMALQYPILFPHDLGRYLGVPILHGRVTKYTYDYLLDHLDSRLAGWKAENLSLTGRVSLASSVLNSLPCYVMQTAFLPVSLCDKIDRKIRNFIWGSSNGVRKLHNVNWETVCKPKSLGGLGLRSARELNQAFLMKVVWGIINKPHELWVQTLMTKYLIRNEMGFTLKRKAGFSALWRGVLKVWNHTLQGIQWSIKDGQKTHFWSDRWLDSGILLRDFALNAQGVDLSLSVSDFTLPDGNWNLDALSGCLPNEVVVQEGWFSLNSNGSLYRNPASSAVGGVIRDSNANFIAAFSANLGVCSIMRSELRAIVEGMKLAWSKGIRRLRIQTDSKAAVAMLSKPFSVNNQHASLIEQFSELSTRDWQVSIHHIYREANCAAHLANLGHSLDLGVHVFEFPDVSLQY